MNMQLEWKVLIRAFPGMPRGGDTGLVLSRPGGALAVLIDASGHGLAAYSVAQKARSTVLNSLSDHPGLLIGELDEALQGTIGAAVSVARIHEDSIEFAGVGNVSASIDLSPFLVQPGVVGQRMRTPRVSSASWAPGQWLLMHTDGVSRPRALPNGNAETVATKLMDAYGSDHDDAGILLVRRKAPES